MTTTSTHHEESTVNQFERLHTHPQHQVRKPWLISFYNRKDKVGIDRVLWAELTPYSLIVVDLYLRNVLGVQWAHTGTEPLTDAVIIQDEDGSQSLPYPVVKRTKTQIVIHDDDTKAITFTLRKSGRFIRKGQPDSVMSTKVIAQLTPSDTGWNTPFTTTNNA